MPKRNFPYTNDFILHSMKNWKCNKHRKKSILVCGRIDMCLYVGGLIVCVWSRMCVCCEYIKIHPFLSSKCYLCIYLVDLLSHYDIQCSVWMASSLSRCLQHWAPSGQFVHLILIWFLFFLHKHVVQWFLLKPYKIPFFLPLRTMSRFLAAPMLCTDVILPILYFWSLLKILTWLIAPTDHYVEHRNALHAHSTQFVFDSIDA